MGDPLLKTNTFYAINGITLLAFGNEIKEWFAFVKAPKSFTGSEKSALLHRKDIFPYLTTRPWFLEN